MSRPKDTVKRASQKVKKVDPKTLTSACDHLKLILQREKKHKHMIHEIMFDPFEPAS